MRPVSLHEVPLPRADDISAAGRIDGAVWQRGTMLWTVAACGLVIGLMTLLFYTGPAVVGMSVALAISLTLQTWRLDEAERVGVLRSVLGLSRSSIVRSRYRDLHLYCAALVGPYAGIVIAGVLVQAMPAEAVMGISHLVGCWYAVSLVAVPVRVRGHSVAGAVLGVVAGLAVLVVQVAVSVGLERILSPGLAHSGVLVLTVALAAAAAPISHASSIRAYDKVDLS